MTMEENKVETSSENSAALSEVESKIVKQLEYYFGDYNLPKDNFLKNQLTLDDGWVPISVLTTFHRLKELSTDSGVISGALTKSTTQLIEVSEDKTKVRRNPQNPPPPEMKKDVEERTFNVKTFPVDTSLDSLLEFFGGHGQVENIYMKRFNNSKKFRGSIFLTYATLEDAQKFREAKVTHYNNVELIVETKADYNKRKQEELGQRKGNKGKAAAPAKQGEEEQPKEENMIRGALLKVTGLGESTKWEDIKALFDPQAKVAHVDHSVGQTEALVRFVDANTAKEALEKTLQGEDKKLLLKDKEISARVLEGEEETEALVDIWKKRRARFENSKKRRGGHGGRGGNRGGKRTRRGDRGSDDLPKAKHTKFDTSDD